MGISVRRHCLGVYLPKFGCVAKTIPSAKLRIPGHVNKRSGKL